MAKTTTFRRWIKARNDPMAELAYRLGLGIRQFSFPMIPGLHHLLYATHVAGRDALRFMLRTLWFTPLFQSRLSTPAPSLFLYGGLPLVMGAVRISVGSNCRISGQTTITGRLGERTPHLSIGDNCDVGWQTTLAVGKNIVIGDNVRIAGRALLAGYPGHPVDTKARARGLPDTDDQAGDIVLEDDVWLATGVTVLAGVRIGRGTIVGAGSVVTHDLPAGVLAAGVPARVVRMLEA